MPGRPQVEYGEGDAGQVEGTKGGSHRNGKSIICQQRKTIICQNERTNGTRWEGSLSLLQTCSIVKGAVKKVCTESDVIISQHGNIYLETGEGWEAGFGQVKFWVGLGGKGLKQVRGEGGQRFFSACKTNCPSWNTRWILNKTCLQCGLKSLVERTAGHADQDGVDDTFFVWYQSELLKFPIFVWYQSQLLKFSFLAPFITMGGFCQAWLKVSDSETPAFSNGNWKRLEKDSRNPLQWRETEEQRAQLSRLPGGGRLPSPEHRLVFSTTKKYWNSEKEANNFQKEGACHHLNLVSYFQQQKKKNRKRKIFSPQQLRTREVAEGARWMFVHCLQGSLSPGWQVFYVQFVKCLFRFF